MVYPELGGERMKDVDKFRIYETPEEERAIRRKAGIAAAVVVGVLALLALCSASPFLP